MNCECKDKYLKCSLWFCRFSKTIVSYSLIPKPILAMASWQLSFLLRGSWVWLERYWFIDVIAREDSWLLSSFRSQHDIYGSMKVSSLGWGSHVSSSSGVFGPVYEVYGVFRNRDLPSASMRQPVATAINCNVLGLYWKIPTNSLKVGFLFLKLWFVRPLAFAGSIASPDKEISLQLCMYTYTQTYMFYSLHRGNWEENSSIQVFWSEKWESRKL